MDGLQIITGMSYDKYINISPSDLIPNAIYLLNNGMMFSQGGKYGNDICVVDEFPVSPIPQVIYFNKNTLEQKMWNNNQWYVLQEELKRLTNSQIDEMFKNDF